MNILPGTKLEDLQKERMLNSAKDIEDAEKYIVNVMDYVTFDKRGRLNNCTEFVNEPHYVDTQTQYARVCLDPSK